MKSSTFNYLVIEDDTNVWANIERRMSRFPEWSESNFVAEIETALQIIDATRPQLIFSDWSIKGGNAFQILNFIKNIQEYCPYIIFFTGYQSEHPEIPQEIMNNYPMVKKYLVKPIYENLTNHLEAYLEEAKHQCDCKPEIKEIFIENEYKQKIKINPQETISIVQCDANPRRKILTLKNENKIYLKQTWEEIILFLQAYQINFHICHNRKAIVNKAYITRYWKPYIWLENGEQIKVSRECWQDLD